MGARCPPHPAPCQGEGGDCGSLGAKFGSRSPHAGEGGVRRWLGGSGRDIVVSAGPSPSIHASAVLVGARAVLIRGPAGCGKSRLALALLAAAKTGRLPFARLGAHDRAPVEASPGRLLVRPAPPLPRLLAVRGLAIMRAPH